MDRVSLLKRAKKTLQKIVYEIDKEEMYMVTKKKSREIKEGLGDILDDEGLYNDVVKILTKKGVLKRQKVGRPKGETILDENIDDVKDMLKNGITIEKIGKKYGMTRQGVSAFLQRKGIGRNE